MAGPLVSLACSLDDCEDCDDPTCEHECHCESEEEYEASLEHESATHRWRVGDGTIRLSLADVSWLLNQPGAPHLAWKVGENWKPWAGPGFTVRNDESADD